MGGGEVRTAFLSLRGGGGDFITRKDVGCECCHVMKGGMKGVADYGRGGRERELKRISIGEDGVDEGEERLGVRDEGGEKGGVGEGGKGCGQRGGGEEDGAYERKLIIETHGLCNTPMMYSLDFLQCSASPRTGLGKLVAHGEREKKGGGRGGRRAIEEFSGGERRDDAPSYQRRCAVINQFIQ